MRWNKYWILNMHVNWSYKENKDKALAIDWEVRLCWYMYIRSFFIKHYAICDLKFLGCIGVFQLNIKPPNSNDFSKCYLQPHFIKCMISEATMISMNLLIWTYFVQIYFLKFRTPFKSILMSSENYVNSLCHWCRQVLVLFWRQCRINENDVIVSGLWCQYREFYPQPLKTTYLIRCSKCYFQISRVCVFQKVYTLYVIQ